MKILSFGSCNIDSVYTVDHILRPGETIAATSVSNFPGGKGLNQTIALARAGAEVFHAGCIGKDGTMLLDCMHQSGVDTRYVRTVDDRTGLAIIQVDKNAENAIVIYSGANGNITREHIDTVLKDFNAGDILLTQNEISQLPYLIRKAADKGMQVVWNPSPFHEDIRSIPLSHISYLILNEVEADGLWGYEDPVQIQQWLQANNPALTVILTLGKKGSAYIDQKHIYNHGAFSVKSVDTTAAGDTFTGYFIACLSKGMEPKVSMRIASAASALTVSRKGASSSIPHLKEVLDILPQLQTNTTAPSDLIRKKIQNYIDENYSNGTLKKLAQVLGYSINYTSNWLKSNMGQSFTAQLQAKKCAVAAQLLTETDLSVSEIIQKVGYKNESFFREIFHKHYGCTPLKYRKRRNS